LRYRVPPTIYQIQDLLYKNPPPNYQAPLPNYQTNPYPRSQAPRPNTTNYQPVPPPQQGNYDPPRPRCEGYSRNFSTLTESRNKQYERLAAAGYLYPVGPKPVDVNSKFYKPDQRCAYHSNSVGNVTEDCINLKYKIKDLIDQEIVSLQPAVPNFTTNLLRNYGGSSVNMIEIDEDWCGTKMITPIVHDELERVVAALSVKEKRDFFILTPSKVFAFVPSRNSRQA